MKSIICIITILMYSFSVALAQVDDINKRSDDNKKDNNNSIGSSSKSESDNNNHSEVGSACAEACIRACAEVFVSVLFDAAAAHHRYQMDKRSEDPTVLSLEFMPHFCKSVDSKYDNYNILPRIRGRWGIWSTEASFNQLVETGDLNNFRTFSWQIMQLNFEAVPVFNFRIGSGLYWENNSSTDPNTKKKNMFNEHSMAIEIKLNDLKSVITLEGRTTWDYNTKHNVYHAISLFDSFRLIKSDHVFVYAVGGIDYQNYYAQVDWFSVRAGLTFNIH